MQADISVFPPFATSNIFFSVTKTTIFIWTSCQNTNFPFMFGHDKNLLNLSSHDLTSLSLSDGLLIAPVLLICSRLKRSFFFISADSLLSVITLLWQAAPCQISLPAVFFSSPLHFHQSEHKILHLPCFSSPWVINSGEPGLLFLPVFLPVLQQRSLLPLIIRWSVELHTRARSK